jgi:hypothetical protein
MEIGLALRRPDPLHPDLFFLFLQIFCIASKEASPRSSKVNPARFLSHTRRSLHRFFFLALEQTNFYLLIS